MNKERVADENHTMPRPTFALLIIITGYLVYAGVRVTLFNIPMRVFGLQIQHELSLALWVFGSIICTVLMAVILDTVRPPRPKTLWKI